MNAELCVGILAVDAESLAVTVVEVALFEGAEVVILQGLVVGVYVLEAFEEPVERILEAIHGVLERTPPELVADISNNGIVMTGGGSLIYGFDKLIESKTGISTRVADDAISCVAYGTGKSLENISNMQDGTMNLSRRKQMN